MTIFEKYRVAKRFPFSGVNVAIAKFLKDGKDLYQVIEIIRKSDVEGHHLRSILYLWYGFGNSEYWGKLFKQCQEEGLFINHLD